MWKRIRRYYSPIIDVLTFSILFVTIVYVIFNFGRLPGEIPRHFNLAGEPDAWSNKGLLIGLLIIYVHTLLLCFVLNYFLIIRSENPKDSLQFINIPFVKKEELTDIQLEIVKIHSARMLAWLNLLVSILFGWMHYGIIQTGLGNQNGLGPGVAIITGLLLVQVVFFTWKIYRDTKQ